MKKGLLFIALTTVLLLTGCQTQAEKASYNLSKEADNFNVVRQITVINCIVGDTLFQMTGRMSIKADMDDNQLEVMVEEIIEGEKTYKKHFIGLSDNVTYVVDDLDVNNVSSYRYTINYNPKMWIPIEFENID